MNPIAFLNYLKNPSIWVPLLSACVLFILHKLKFISISHGFLFYAGFIYPYISLFILGKYEKERDKRIIEMNSEDFKAKLKQDEQLLKKEDKIRNKILEKYDYLESVGHLVSKEDPEFKICNECAHKSPPKEIRIIDLTKKVNPLKLSYRCSISLCGYEICVDNPDHKTRPVPTRNSLY